VVIFGSFNNAMKLSPSTTKLWAEVMQAVPKSKLLLKAPSFRDQSVQQRFVQSFAAHGVMRDRLIIRGPSGLYDMMQEYSDIDLALDPIPYNGGTTTLQALWMGVPVVSLEGHNFVSRMGTSFLQNLGQADWIANNHQMYVHIAKQLSGRVPELRQQRQQLRDKLINSPLGDIKRFVDHFEALLLQMWQLYCEQKSTRLMTVSLNQRPTN